MTAGGLSDLPSSLDRAISGDRLGGYDAAAGGDRALARQLYVWDRDVSLAIMADIAILEVAFRNALHDAFSRRWGQRWYSSRDVVLDDRSIKQLASAWKQLPVGMRQNPDGSLVPGKLVAHCMFGFWVNLLDAGDHFGEAPRRIRANYNDLWREAGHAAFRGGRAEARRQGENYTRAWAHSVVKNINTLRNRVAHHEPLINGFPLPGQQARMTAMEGHEECLKLARMIDRDLATWLATNTRVPTLLASRPH